MKTRLIFFSIAILVTVGCTPKECRDVKDIELKLLADYSPLVDTFSIGDTLTIFSDFSDMIEDINSGSHFYIEDFDFFTTIILRRYENGNGVSIDLDTNGDQIVNANVDYSFYNYNTTIDKATGIDIIQHNYENNNYSFSLGYIFRKSGLYVVAVNSLLGFSNATDNQEIDGQCPGQKLHARSYQRPDNSNNILEDYNFTFLEGIELYESTTEEEFRTRAMYAFFVKE